MPDFFHLNNFQKFELWLSALHSFHRNPGLPFGALESLPLQRNYLDDVKTSLHITQDLIELSKEIAREQLKRLQEIDPEIRIESQRDPRNLIQRYRGSSEDYFELIQLWEFLEQVRVLGMSLIRLSHLSRSEFKAFSYLLITQIRRFQTSECQAILKQGSAEFVFRDLAHKELVSGLDMPGVQEQIEIILVEFFQILKLLRYIQDEMRVRFQVRKLLVLFAYSYYSYHAFVRLLSDTRDYLDKYQPKVVEAIFSTTFALKMETKKVFGERLAAIGPDTPVQLTYAEMEDALGLIQNAFRECFISLAHLLSPEFDERRLFDDMRDRYEDTLMLLEDLGSLHSLAATGPECADETWDLVKSKLKEFEENSMRHLFFKDWHDFEEFEREFAKTEAAQRRFLLHRFEIFLNTLISEVRKRSVLSKFQSNAPGPKPFPRKRTSYEGITVIESATPLRTGSR